MASHAARLRLWTATASFGLAQTMHRPSLILETGIIRSSISILICVVFQGWLVTRGCLKLLGIFLWSIDQLLLG